jgi:hypothetical protein
LRFLKEEGEIASGGDTELAFAEQDVDRQTTRLLNARSSLEGLGSAQVRGFDPPQQRAVSDRDNGRRHYSLRHLRARIVRCNGRGIRNAISSESSTSLTLLIVGHSTPRSVQQLSFQFNPATGASLQTKTLTADVSTQFDTWFQSTSGISFGSQFAATVQLNVSGTLSSIRRLPVNR